MHIHIGGIFFFFLKKAQDSFYFFLFVKQCLQRAFNKTVDVISQFVQYEARFETVVFILVVLHEQVWDETYV